MAMHAHRAYTLIIFNGKHARERKMWENYVTRIWVVGFSFLLMVLLLLLLLNVYGNWLFNLYIDSLGEHIHTLTNQNTQQQKTKTQKTPHHINIRYAYVVAPMGHAHVVFQMKCQIAKNLFHTAYIFLFYSIQ